MLRKSSRPAKPFSQFVTLINVELPTRPELRPQKGSFDERLSRCQEFSE